jgi:hypothetical protein
LGVTFVTKVSDLKMLGSQMARHVVLVAGRHSTVIANKWHYGLPSFSLFHSVSFTMITELDVIGEGLGAILADQVQGVEVAGHVEEN